MKFEGIDYKAAAMLVRYGMDHFKIRNLGLERIVPKRRYHRGQEPGVTSKESLGGDGDRDEDKWIFPPRDPTETEKRKLITACLEIGVRTCFKLSVYQFGGNITSRDQEVPSEPGSLWPPPGSSCITGGKTSGGF